MLSLGTVFEEVMSDWSFCIFQDMFLKHKHFSHDRYFLFGKLTFIFLHAVFNSSIPYTGSSKH